jgi:hypothetical protein
MNAKLKMRTKRTLFALAAAAALAAGTAIGDDSQTVKSSNVDSMSKWYGRAGGLVGTDRVSAARTSGTKIGITYDKDVAERTNMAREPVDGKSVGISYDKDVAERTNLPRGQTVPEPAKAAVAPTSKP